jgi:hypothetical protein
VRGHRAAQSDRRSNASKTKLNLTPEPGSKHTGSKAFWPSPTLRQMKKDKGFACLGPHRRKPYRPMRVTLTVIANRRRDAPCATSIGDDGDADLQPRLALSALARRL